MAFNRDLSRFAAYLDLDAAGNYIGITSAESTTNFGIGVTNPESKLSVVGDANITGVVTASQFYGNIDYSYVLNATSGVRTEFSVVDNGGDGSLSYDNQTGIISYVGPSASEARAHFSATSSDLGSLTYDSETGVFAYTGVTTSNIRGQFSSSSADIGTLSYNSTTGEISLAGVTTSAIRDQFSGGTGVTISNGEVSIEQPVGTTDEVTFASVTSTGIVTAAQFVTGASGEAIGINTNTISGPETLILDPAAVGDDTGKVVIKGDLQVDGTETIINSTTVTVEDKNIQIADGAINDAAADGAGITVNSGDGNKTFQFNDASDAFKSNISLDVASGEVYKVNGTEVLSSNTLGSGVVNSSLTSVGTLGKLDVGNVDSTGIVTATGGFDGDLTGDVTGNADTATTLETPRSFEITGDVVASAINFDGSGNVSFAATIQPNSVALGDDTTGNYVATIADSGNTNITVNNSGTENAAVTLDLTDTTVSAGSYGSSSEIPTFTVDAKGRLTAAGTVSVSTGMTVAGDSGSEVIDLLTETLTIAGGTNLTSSAASDTVTVNLDDNISLTSVSASGVITATSGFDGDLTGDVTGNLTGEVNATAFDTNESGVVVTGIATATGFAGDLTGDVTGNADTATALETARDFSTSGDATAPSVSFDGSGNVDLVLTLADTTVSAGSYGSSTEIPTFTVDSKGRLTAAGTASVGTALTIAGDSGSEVIDLLSESLTIAGGTNLTSSAASDTVTVNLDSDISLDSVTATGIITAAQFVTGASGEAIGINTNTISGPDTLILDPAAVGDNTGKVVIKGDLQVDGTETIVNSTTVTVNDKNIQIADGAANDAAADGAGITVNSGDGNKTFQFSDANDSFQANIALDVTSGNVYKVDGTEVLSSDTLGSGVVNSSLTSVGTLGQLNVTGVTTSTGGFDGDLTGDVTGNADTATALETARDFSISGDATASAVSFDGTANVGLALTLADTAVSAGSYGSSTEIPTFTVDSKGRLTAAGTASVGTALTIAGDSGSEVIDLLTESLTIAGGTNLTSSAASDTLTLDLDSDISLDSVTATGIITATGGFDGDVTGNLNSSGLSTVTNLEVGGYISAGSTTGTNEQVMMSTGVGVTWSTITDILPEARTGLTTTASDGQTAFSFEYNVNYLDVFVNGVKLSNSDFTATNGSDITLAEGAFAGDKVEFVSYNTVGTGSGSVNSLNDLSDVTIASQSAGDILSYNGSEYVNQQTLNLSGILTASAFYGDGSNLTGIDATALKDAGGNVKIQANESGAVLTGILTTTGAVNVGGNLTVTGNLTVDGTTTTINSTTLTVDDKNIVVASGAADANAADGAGLTVDGANATFTYASTGDKFVSNKDVEAPNFNSTSDRNLKDNIRPVEGASELVSNLEGVHFTWKSNGQETIGVIAQQIEEHLPQLVQTGETHKTVNYNGLIGVLIEAVKEQGSQIAALKAEIEELKK